MTYQSMSNAHHALCVLHLHPCYIMHYNDVILHDRSPKVLIMRDSDVYTSLSRIMSALGICSVSRRIYSELIVSVRYVRVSTDILSLGSSTT